MRLAQYRQASPWPEKVLGIHEYASSKSLYDVWRVSILTMDGRKGVRENQYAPHCDANTGARSKTSTCHRAIIRGLLRQASRRRRQARETHIDLRVRHLDAKRSKGIDLGQQRRLAGRRPHNEMPLQTDAVNLGAVRLDLLDEGHGVGGLGARVLDVVVVIVQLGGRVGSGGGGKGYRDVVEAHGVVEDVGAVAARVVEGFVDDVPGVALPLVVADFAGDVCLDGGG